MNLNKYSCCLLACIHVLCSNIVSAIFRSRLLVNHKIQNYFVCLERRSDWHATNGNRSSPRRSDNVLHLHGLHNGQFLSNLNRITLLDGIVDKCSRHWRQYHIACVDFSRWVHVLAEFVFAWTLEKNLHVGSHHLNVILTRCLGGQHLERLLLGATVQADSGKEIGRLVRRLLIQGNGTFKRFFSLFLWYGCHLEACAVVQSFDSQSFTKDTTQSYHNLSTRVFFQRNHANRQILLVLSRQLHALETFGIVGWQKRRWRLSLLKGRVCDNIHNQPSIVLNVTNATSTNYIFLHGLMHLIKSRLSTVGTPRHNLAQHGVVVGCHNMTLGNATVDP
mmetsp:Transcript_2431/g.3823  ORF Transcript_2431/g.3823 Transcript_2431/m.3823 type:complete len:334 (+) Transcript_2431:46-1047(+)